MQKNFFKKAVVAFLFFGFIYSNIAAQTPALTKGVIVTSTAPADTTKGEKYAIITGVSKYQHITGLQFADADAILFRKFLLSPAGGNTKQENIISFINESATASGFNLEARRWLKNKKLKKGDQLYFYFSGHGDASEEGLYFFLAYDCYPNNDEHNYTMGGAIDLSQIKKLIKYYTDKGVEVLFILDACRTNELSGGEKGQKNLTTFIAEEKMGEIILLSTSPNQVSIESASIGGGHGLYSYYLIDGLVGAADKEVLGDDDGKVSLAEISAFTIQKVTKRAKADFKITQVPYSCCSEKNQEIITTIDTPTYTAWEGKKKLQLLISDTNALAFNVTSPGAKGIGDLSDKDSLQINMYNRFTEALKSEKFTGDSSAETIYSEMESKWPGHPITSEVKYALAVTYLNFCQQKINLFLSGKGLIHIINMGKEVKKENTDNENIAVANIEEQINKLTTLVTTGYDVAAKMMDKAFELLKDDPEIKEPIIPKYNFIKTMAAYADKTNKLKDVLEYCTKLLESDTASPAGYLLKGWIYQDMQHDSCEYYFTKAAAIAPKWAYPINSLGNFYFSKNKYEDAKKYFNNAIQLDSLNVSAYRNTGLIYYNESGMNYDELTGIQSGMVQEKLNTAEAFFRKALKLDSCDVYANEYLGKVMQDYISHNFGSSTYDNTQFKIAERFYLRSIKCDTNFASGYQKLAALYAKANSHEKALAILQKCVTVNPANAEGYRNLGTFYQKTKSALQDDAKAETIFKKAIQIDPFTDKNYYALARLYKNQSNKEKAIEVYKEAWTKIGDNKNLFNDIANTYLDKLYQLDSATTYYNKALEIDSTLDYVYYNLSLVHNAKSSINDSIIYYYSKAVFYNPYRWQKLNRIIANFYYEKKDLTQAKNYYTNSLKAKNKYFYSDIDLLIKILIEEKAFATAESTLKQYLNAETDSEIYERLLEKIAKASGNN